MKLSAERIQENWNKLIQLIENTFEGKRKEKLLHFAKGECSLTSPTEFSSN